MDIKNMVEEVKEIAQAWGDFARDLEQIEKKYADYEESEALEQEPKVGHWEYVQYDYNPKLGNWHCSECRCIAVECANKEKENSNPLYKYCPNCGAKMESEVKEHDERTSN